jgi:hypothetical protein
VSFFLAILDNKNAKTPSDDDQISVMELIPRSSSLKHTELGWD